MHLIEEVEEMLQDPFPYFKLKSEEVGNKTFTGLTLYWLIQTKVRPIFE